MSAWAKVVTSVLGFGIPLAAFGADLEWFSSNPLVVVAAITAIAGVALYLTTYQDRE